MKMVKLGDVAHVTMGQAPPGSSYNSEELGKPLIAGAGDFCDGRARPTKYTSEPKKIANPKDIILSIRASIGDKVWADQELCLGRGVAGIKPGQEMNANFLWHLLDQLQPSLLAKAKGATFLQVNRSDIESLTFPLPPLDEQRRIAAILNSIESFEIMLKKKIKLLHNLVDASLEQFINSRNIEVAPLRDITTKVTVGVVVKPASYYTDTGIPALRTLNISPGSIDTSKLVYFSKESHRGPLKKSILQEGDLLTARTGNTGATAMVPPQLANSNAIDLIITRPNPSVVRPSFLESVINSRRSQSTVSSQSRGQIQQHFNVKLMNELAIPVPPLETQDAFCNLKERLNLTTNGCKIQLDNIRTLRLSITARAFRGEL